MFPAEHKGHTATRMWYKVRWVRNPHPDKKEWDGMEGRIDLVMDEDLDLYSGFVQVLGEIRADTCATGPVLGFGKLDEKQIDEWIRQNAK